LGAPDSGFTRDAVTGKPVTSGYAVAIGGSDMLINADEAFTNGRVNPKLVDMYVNRMDAARSFDAPPGTKTAVGAWTNPADMKTEMNVTVVFPKGDQAGAMAFAKANDQIAMFSLHDFEVIDTGGTGGERNVA
jgi:hypothetical protein